MRRWSLVEADLHDRYGIDLDEPGLLERRSWRWLRVRVEQLLTVPPSQYGRAAIHNTRIGHALAPPQPKTSS